MMPRAAVRPTVGRMDALPRTAVEPVDPRNVRWQVDTGRFWRGAFATAAAAACTAAVGLLIVRGLFGLHVLRRSDGGGFEQASSWWYLTVSVLAALVASGLLLLLLSYSPRPWKFFEWISGLVVALVTLAPLTFNASTSTKVATALLHLAVGVVIVAFVEMVGHACAVLVVDEPAY
jgi:nitrate reductase gamma subunit